MKAYVLHGINDIKYEDVKKPVPGPGELLIKVKAAGICGSDIPRIYQNGAHKHPIVPGHEFAGIVEEAGPETNTNLVGKRVGVFPLIPCRKCGPCLHKQYEMCENYDYLGSRSDGAFAEYVVAPERNIIVLNDNVSTESAAMLEPLSVSAHAVRAVVQDITSRDSKILVWGLGTIGIMLTMILKSEGFTEIYCACNKEYQENILKEKLGIQSEHIVNINNTSKPVDELISRIGSGFDICFECVGHPDSINCVVDAAGPSAKVMFVGNPYSDIIFKRDTYWKILRHQLEVHGTWNSSFTGDENDDWHYVLNAISSGRINPDFLVTQKFTLSDLSKGFEIMRDKALPYIKIICED